MHRIFAYVGPVRGLLPVLARELSAKPLERVKERAKPVQSQAARSRQYKVLH